MKQYGEWLRLIGKYTGLAGRVGLKNNDLIVLVAILIINSYCKFASIETCDGGKGTSHSRLFL